MQTLTMHWGKPSRLRLRRAFTLMEMMIVLVVLVIVAAIAVPSFYRTLRDQTLRSAAELVRTEWNKAHIKAMKTGRIQVFRFQPGGRKFQVEPYQAADDALEGAKPLTNIESAAPAPSVDGQEDENSRTQLPEGITFLDGVTAEEERAKAVESSLGGGGGEWSQPILFYPDGVSSDAWLVVADEHDSAIRLELRGLTGLAVLGDLTTPDEAQQAD